jgi:poly(3-hydroxyalkanoate) synthetase
MIGITKDHEIVKQRMRVKKINFVGMHEGGSLAVRGKGKSIVKH